MSKHGHIQHDVFENRNQFQLERLILFTDAVFAIAITLLIIDIKLPHEISDTNSGYEVWQLLKTLTLKCIGFIFSFLLIGGYWMAHHRMFKYVTGYNTSLIWLNLLLLMSIVFLPFTTALAFENMTTDIDTAFIVYSFNHILVGVVFILLWRYLAKNDGKLSIGLGDKKFMQYNYLRAASIIIIFLLIAVLCVLKPTIARFFTIFTVFVIPLLNRLYRIKK